MSTIRKSHRRKVPRQPALTTSDNDTTPIWGAAAIGAVIGRTERQAYHLLESHALKGAKKIRGTWSAVPSVLLRAWESDEAGGE
jgi:hypothetical protein